MKTTNKLLKGILITGLSLFSLIISANNLPSKVEMHETEKIIKETIKVPLDYYLNNEKVEVFFSTNQKGAVDFVLAKTDNKILKQEIEKQFHKMSLSKLKEDVVNSIVINFKTI